MEVRQMALTHFFYAEMDWYRTSTNTGKGSGLTHHRGHAKAKEVIPRIGRIPST